MTRDHFFNKRLRIETSGSATEGFSTEAMQACGGGTFGPAAVAGPSALGRASKPAKPTRIIAATNETLRPALGLGNRTWRLGFTVGGGALPPRIRTIDARSRHTARRRPHRQHARCPSDAAGDSGGGVVEWGAVSPGCARAPRARVAPADLPPGELPTLVADRQTIKNAR